MKALTLHQSAHLVYQLFRESARSTRDSATVALGVFDGKRVVVGLILQVEDDMLRTVTPLDSLQLDAPLTVSAESFERLWDALIHTLKPPAAALLCDRATFEGLVQAENKLSYLAAVGHTQPYFYRVELP